VAQLVVRWLAVKQARVRISARHPIEVPPTEYTELQRVLSGVHSVMRVKLALAGEGGGCTFITFTISSKVAVYAPAEWADTLTLFHLL
jgi:hypothetical protein